MEFLAKAPGYLEAWYQAARELQAEDDLREAMANSFYTDEENQHEYFEHLINKMYPDDMEKRNQLFKDISRSSLGVKRRLRAAAKEAAKNKGI